MSRYKRNQSARPTRILGEALRQAEYRAQEAEGKLYRVDPVDLETFVTSPEYLGQNMWGMSDAQKEYLESAADFENGINFYVLYVGKGGGKNWSSIVLFLYMVHKLLCMWDAHAYLDHNKAKDLTFMNVAINAKQAQKNFFDPLKNMVENAGEKAFRRFGFNFDTDVKINEIRFPQGITILSTNSSAGGVEGYDILAALIDEVDDTEFVSADKIIDTLRTSAQSRFVGKEKIITISYRRYVGSSGKILQLFNNSQGHKHIYARRYASWEFHPKLTREDFQNFYDENPEQADCMYGSSLTGSFADSWMKDIPRIKKAMNIEREWILDWPLPYDPDPVGSERWWARDTHAAWVTSPASEHSYTDSSGALRELDPYNLPIRVLGDPDHKYIFVGDPALGSDLNGGDGYGVCLAHREIVEGPRGEKYVRPVIDFSFRFTGRMFEEKQVQMVAIEKLIKRLIHNYGYNIKIFSFDGWNSASLTQWISNTYKDAIVYDRAIVGFKEYESLRSALSGEAPPSSGKGDKENNGGIDIPWHPILFEELKGLREDRRTTPPRIDHPNNGSKDIADTVARAVHIAKNLWPFTDTTIVGSVTETAETKLAAKIRSQTATEEDLNNYYKEVQGEAAGLGNRFEKNAHSPLRLEELLPNVRS